MFICTKCNKEDLSSTELEACEDIFTNVLSNQQVVIINKEKQEEIYGKSELG